MGKTFSGVPFPFSPIKNAFSFFFAKADFTVSVMVWPLSLFLLLSFFFPSPSVPGRTLGFPPFFCQL